MELISSVISQRIAALFLALVVGCCIALFVEKYKYFKLSPENNETIYPLHWKYVVLAYLLFLGIEMMIVPELYHTVISRTFERGSIPSDLDILYRGWLNIISAACSFLALIVLVYIMPQTDQRAVLGYSEERSTVSLLAKSYWKGCISWFVIYPWIVAVGQAISIFTTLLFPGPEIDQVAVKHLKDIVDFPWLFGMTILFIVTVIPCLEELLFRGFLQGYIKGFFGRALGILITSVIFSSFHFSSSQGIENVEVVVSLFVLSLFLGFLKEKLSTVWASIGLHSTFNAVSILLLLATGK